MADVKPLLEFASNTLVLTLYSTLLRFTDLATSDLQSKALNLNHTTYQNSKR